MELTEPYHHYPDANVRPGQLILLILAQEVKPNRESNGANVSP